MSPHGLETYKYCNLSLRYSAQNITKLYCLFDDIFPYQIHLYQCLYLAVAFVSWYTRVRQRSDQPVIGRHQHSEKDSFLHTVTCYIATREIVLEDPNKTQPFTQTTLNVLDIHLFPTSNH